MGFVEGRERKAGLTLSAISLSDRGRLGGAIDICSRAASSLPLTLASSGMGGCLGASGGWGGGDRRRSPSGMVEGEPVGGWFEGGVILILL